MNSIKSYMEGVKPIPSTDAEKQALKIHIFTTYNYLRWGMGALALIFPLVLYVVGKCHAIDLQGSMSAYYWAGADGIIAPRNIFVGFLLALSAFFLLYKGFTRPENILLNLAAVFAAMVAFFPMSWNCPGMEKQLPPLNISYCPSCWNPHGTSAVALFVCLALVSLFCAHATLPALDNQKQLQRIFKIAYNITGSLMVLSPVVAAVLRILFNRLDSMTYFIELTGVMSFAIFWLVKSDELRRTKLDWNALDAQDNLS